MDSFIGNKSCQMGNGEPWVSHPDVTSSDPSGSSHILSVDRGPDTKSCFQIPPNMKKGLSSALRDTSLEMKSPG